MNLEIYIWNPVVYRWQNHGQGWDPPRACIKWEMIFWKIKPILKDRKGRMSWYKRLRKTLQRSKKIIEEIISGMTIQWGTPTELWRSALSSVLDNFSRVKKKSQKNVFKGWMVKKEEGIMLTPGQRGKQGKVCVSILKSWANSSYLWLSAHAYDRFSSLPQFYFVHSTHLSALR